MKFLRSRFFWGILALALATAVIFVGLPYLNGQTRETQTVVRLKQPVPAETQITESMLTKMEVGAYGLPDEVFTTTKAVVGLYSAVDIVPTDNLVPSKFTSTLARKNESFYTLQEHGKMVVSVPLSGLAASVSGKIQEDDIVTVFAITRNSTSDSYDVTAHPELLYMRVAAVTNAVAMDTVEVDTKSSTTAASAVVPATITLYATDFQARRLIEIQASGSVHVALVGRGENAVALYEKYIPVDPYAVVVLPETEVIAEQEGVPDGTEAN